MKTTARHTTLVSKAAVLQKITPTTAAGLALVAVLLSSAGAAAAPEPHRHTKIPAGSGITLNLIEIDLTADMEIVSAGFNNYTAVKNFETLARNSGAAAAINGCFFDLSNGKLVGHIYRNGRQEVKGAFGAAFAVAKDNRPVIAHIKDLGDTSNYRVIISCVDILMKDGKTLVNSKADLVRNGHSPSSKNNIYKPARWSAIGIGKSGKVYLVGTAQKTSIYNFTKKVAAYTEIVDMLGLDGGTSSGLYYEGKILIRPGRPVASIIAARATSPKPIAIAAR